MTARGPTGPAHEQRMRTGPRGTWSSSRASDRPDRSDLDRAEGLLELLDLIGRDLDDETVTALQWDPHDDGAAFLDEFFRSNSDLVRFDAQS